jgi:hypothetical protein
MVGQIGFTSKIISLAIQETVASCLARRQLLGQRKVPNNWLSSDMWIWSKLANCYFKITTPSLYLRGTPYSLLQNIFHCLNMVKTKYTSVFVALFYSTSLFSPQYKAFKHAGPDFDRFHFINRKTRHTTSIKFRTGAMSPPVKCRRLSLADNFHYLEKAHCNHSISSLANGTGNLAPQIWQFPNGTTLINDTENLTQTTSSSTNRTGDLQQQIWQFPNGTRLINGTILGCINSTQTNITTTMANGTSTNNNTIPHNGTSVINGTSMSNGPASNNGTTANSTIAASNTNSISHITSAVLVPAIFVPVASLVLISVVLCIFRTYWKDRTPSDTTEKSTGHSESKEFGLSGCFENDRADMRVQDSVTSSEPAYKA